MQPGHPRDLLDNLLERVDNETDADSPFYNGDRNNNTVKHRGGADSSLGPGDLTVLNILIDLFMAGFETTTSSLSWTFLYLLHNQDIQQKVHDEIDSVVGVGRMPSVSDRKSMPYTNAVLHESFRITGFVFLSFPHLLTADVKLDEDTVLPEGTNVMPNLYHVMNDPEYWSEPRAFKPERFIDGDGKFVPDERVVPFSMGKRICPGQVKVVICHYCEMRLFLILIFFLKFQSLAEMEMFVFFTSLLQRYRLSAHPDAPELPGYDELATEPESSLRSPPRYQVQLTPR